MTCPATTARGANIVYAEEPFDLTDVVHRTRVGIEVRSGAAIASNITSAQRQSVDICRPQHIPVPHVLPQDVCIATLLKCSPATPATVTPCALIHEPVVFNQVYVFGVEVYSFQFARPFSALAPAGLLAARATRSAI